MYRAGFPFYIPYIPWLAPAHHFFGLTHFLLLLLMKTSDISVKLILSLGIQFFSQKRNVHIQVKSNRLRQFKSKINLIEKENLNPKFKHHLGTILHILL